MAQGQINDRGFLVEYTKPIRFLRGGWLEPRGSVCLLEDFIADTVAEDSTVTINQSGTPTTAAAISATAGAPTAGHGGWLAGSVDNVDAEIDEIALGAKPWLSVARADTSVVVAEAGFVVPTALTARQYFFGFSDDETEGTATNGPLNIQTGVTIVDVATDAVGFIMSSLATDADGYYYANTNAGTQSTNGTASGLTAVVDDYTVLRVEVDVLGNAYLYGAISGADVPTEVPWLATVATAVATTGLLIPIFTAAATTTTAVEWEIDYLFGAGPR